MEVTGHGELMQNIHEFLYSLDQRGVKIWSDNGHIRFQAPKGTLGPQDLNKLSALKVEILEFLEQVSLDLDAPIQPRRVGCRVPLIPRLRFLWNAANVNGARRSRRMSGKTVRISGPLNIPLLRRSIEAVVCRHESLRTRFVEIDGVPTHHIDAAGECPLSVVDLSGDSHSNTEEEVHRICVDLFQEKIDLSIGPLFAAKLFELPGHEHVLAVSFDHMISDRISVEIVCREIWTLYRQAIQGVPFSLATLPVQFADYAVWQERTAAAWLKLHSGYWRQRLQGVQPTKFPGDERVAAAGQPSSAALVIPFGCQLSSELREVARRTRTLPALVILTVYAAVMSRWCGQRDLVIKFPSNGRYRPELINMVGWISSPLYLRVEITEKDSLLDLLKKVDLEFNSAYEHYDFNRVPELIPECVTELNLNCVPRVLGASAHMGHSLEIGDQVKIQPFPIRVVHPPGVLSTLHEGESEIFFRIVYPTHRFAQSTIEKVGHEIRLFAQEFADNPSTRVTSISM